MYHSVFGIIIFKWFLILDSYIKWQVHVWFRWWLVAYSAPRHSFSPCSTYHCEGPIRTLFNQQLQTVWKIRCFCSRKGSCHEAMASLGINELTLQGSSLCIYGNQTWLSLCLQMAQHLKVLGHQQVHWWIECKHKTLRPRQNGGHFPEDFLKWISVNENVWILINILLKFVLMGPINNISAMVQIRLGADQVTSH